MVQGDALMIQHASPPEAVKVRSFNLDSQATGCNTACLPSTATPAVEAQQTPSVQAPFRLAMTQLLAMPSRHRSQALAASNVASVPHPENADHNSANSAGAFSPSLATPDVYGNMQAELLGHVLKQVKWSGREAIALSAVCR